MQAGITRLPAEASAQAGIYTDISVLCAAPKYCRHCDDAQSVRSNPLFGIKEIALVVSNTQNITTTAKRSNYAGLRVKQIRHCVILFIQRTPRARGMSKDRVEGIEQLLLPDGQGAFIMSLWAGT